MRLGHQVILEARKRGVMIRPLGDVIVLMPPLSMSDGELTILLDVVHDCIVTVTGKLNGPSDLYHRHGHRRRQNVFYLRPGAVVEVLRLYCRCHEAG